MVTRTQWRYTPNLSYNRSICMTWLQSSKQQPAIEKLRGTDKRMTRYSYVHEPAVGVTSAHLTELRDDYVTRPFLLFLNSHQEEYSKNSVACVCVWIPTSVEWTHGTISLYHQKIHLISFVPSYLQWIYQLDENSINPSVNYCPDEKSHCQDVPGLQNVNLTRQALTTHCFSTYSYLFEHETEWHIYT